MRNTSYCIEKTNFNLILSQSINEHYVISIRHISNFVLFFISMCT